MICSHPFHWPTCRKTDEERVECAQFRHFCPIPSRMSESWPILSRDDTPMRVEGPSCRLLCVFSPFPSRKSRKSRKCQIPIKPAGKPSRKWRKEEELSVISSRKERKRAESPNIKPHETGRKPAESGIFRHSGKKEQNRAESPETHETGREQGRNAALLTRFLPK